MPNQNENYPKDIFNAIEDQEQEDFENKGRQTERVDLSDGVSLFVKRDGKRYERTLEVVKEGYIAQFAIIDGKLLIEDGFSLSGPPGEENTHFTRSPKFRKYFPEKAEKIYEVIKSQRSELLKDNKNIFSSQE
jgi:hypothetical protein